MGAWMESGLATVVGWRSEAVLASNAREDVRQLEFPDGSRGFFTAWGHRSKAVYYSAKPQLGARGLEASWLSGSVAQSIGSLVSYVTG